MCLKLVIILLWVSVEPYWNLNTVNLICPSSMSVVSVEPYWNLNISVNDYYNKVQSVSVEPYWNLNKHINNKWIYINWYQ